MLSEEATKLIAAFAEAQFECGEWVNDDDESYEEVVGRSDLARANLSDYVAKLERAALSDATGVR